MWKIEPIRLSKVQDGLSTEILGYPLICFRELPSTNDMAKDLAARGAREGMVIVAETQTRGRGRFKRGWVSPSGGMWFSIILRPKIEPRYSPKLTLMVSVAVAKAILELFPLKVEIKWPNDVLVNRKKVCGILTEAKTRGETLDFVIVGIGINANFSVNALPIDLRASSTTLRDELKKEIERESLLRILLEEIESGYSLFVNGRFDRILTEWRSMASFLGSYVEVVSQGETIQGWAVDVDQEGALIVRLRDRTARRVTSGDLTILDTKG